MTVRVNLNTSDFELKLAEHLNDKSKIIAAKIRVDARASTAFKDVTGRLRKSIRSRKSRFEEGGHLVKAGGPGAMQAWLVEHGHGGPAPAPPHPYLRPALVRNIDFARRKFAEKMNG